MPDISVLIKPSSGMCNMQCSYCFYRALTGEKCFDKSLFINETTMENIIRKCIDVADHNVYLAFQGGEPTLIGKDFYRHLNTIINKYNNKDIVFHFAIQTNGLLLDDEWCQIFKDNNYLVGLSFDGIKPIHDKYRKDQSNNGTYDRVRNIIQLLKKHDVDFNILTVVTDDLTKNANEYFFQMKELGISYIQLLECIDPLSTGPYANEYSLQDKNYGIFLVDLFDNWKTYLGTEKYIHINYFENLMALLLGKSPSDCGMFGYCSSQFVIENNGDVYPCDFYVLPKYLIGNINKDSFIEMKKRKITKQFESESFELDYSCGDCKYIKLCRGGCRRTRERINELSKSFLCESIKYFLDNRLSELVDIAKKAAQGYYRTSR